MIRLGALALYAVVSGLGGALITGSVLGPRSGHFLALVRVVASLWHDRL